MKEKTMINHVILTVSDVERSLAFYEAALQPVGIRFFMPYKGEKWPSRPLGFRRRKESLLLAQARKA